MLVNKRPNQALWRNLLKLATDRIPDWLLRSLRRFRSLERLSLLRMGKETQIPSNPTHDMLGIHCVAHWSSYGPR